MTDPAPPKVSATIRVGAAFAGVVMLALATLFTLGAAWLAPLGMFIAHRVARRHGRPATRAGSWLGASVTCTVAVAIALAVTMGFGAPDGYIDQVTTQAAEQARARPTQLPAWFGRIAPAAPHQAAADSAAARLAGSRAFTSAAITGGLLLASVLWGVVAGSAGWATTVLFALALTGRSPVRPAG